MKKTTIKKTKDVILGLLLIFAAALLILRSTDVALPLLGGLSIIKIAGAVVVLTFIIFRLIDKKLSFILQALTILYGIFLEEIALAAGIKESSLPSFWIVFLCSIIIEIGIKLIFKRKKEFNFGNFDFSFTNDDDDDDENENYISNEGVSCNGHKVGEISRYIDCRDFKRAEFGKLVGQVNIYFDNTDAYEGGGELVFGQLVGEVNVYVPAQWKIRTFTTGFLGEVDVEPSDSEGDKILYIKGSRTVGQINVRRR